MDCLTEENDFVCVYGLSAEVYEQAREWLDQGNRRLVFVDDRPDALENLRKSEDAILLLNDLRVKIYILESPLQIEPVAKRVAWDAVLQKMAIHQLRPAETFQKALEHYHMGANLLLSDMADYGISLSQNWRASLKIPKKSGLALKEKFKGIPALIVGAGPSLEKCKPLMESFEGLIFAGGAALSAIEREPHFAASIDKESPYRQFKMHPWFETPFCFQSRMNRENQALIHGPALLFPESNAPWINWLNDQEIEFETGWTVGNFLTAAALYFGCNPILFAGMDLCYGGEQKYSHIQMPLGPEAIQVNGVWTQRDWVMAARWTENLAALNPQTQFYHAATGSLCHLDVAPSFSFQPQGDLRRKIFDEIESIPYLQTDRWQEWESSLRRCKLNSDAYHVDEDEIVYQLLLKPLWDVWKPVFERELIYDTQKDKMDLNRHLFFQQVLQEHIDG